MGAAPDQVKLAQSVADAELVEVSDSNRVAYATQTTLSLDDVSVIVETLRRRFPAMVGPEAGDGCHATTKSQEAVHAVGQTPTAAEGPVPGPTNSSNSAPSPQV